MQVDILVEVRHKHRPVIYRKGGALVKAVVFREFGGSDVLRLEELDDPAPGPGEVALDVSACALNHLDVDVREGVSRFPVEPPHVLGLEVVGRIAELGEGVDGWQLGERVMPYLMDTCGSCRFCVTGRESLCLSAGFISFAHTGGYAERLVCSASQLIRVPDEIGDAEAAALQIAFATAWHMLFTRGNLRAGETVLVNSVGSGIGSAAVQLAHMAGAYVIGNASSDEKLARASELGMDAGINHSTHDVAEEVMRLTDGRGVDLVYEHVGGELFQAGLDSLSKDGRLVICGGHSGEVVPFDIIPFFRAQKSVIGSFVYTRAEVETCLELARRGVIMPIVHETLPLDRAKDAMDLMESRKFFGKIVLAPVAGS
jgi:NADPH:quinone reductase-like Zn-dependent oxidoreductase